jgi:hypothetical protein
MRYKQYEDLASGYEKHPDQGLKTCKKKLQRDPKNVVYLVRFCLSSDTNTTYKLTRCSLRKHISCKDSLASKRLWKVAQPSRDHQRSHYRLSCLLPSRISSRLVNTHFQHLRIWVEAASPLYGKTLSTLALEASEPLGGGRKSTATCSGQL